MRESEATLLCQRESRADQAAIFSVALWLWLVRLWQTNVMDHAPSTDRPSACKPTRMSQTYTVFARQFNYFAAQMTTLGAVENQRDTRGA